MDSLKQNSDIPAVLKLIQDKTNSLKQKRDIADRLRFISDIAARFKVISVISGHCVQNVILKENLYNRYIIK